MCGENPNPTPVAVSGAAFASPVVVCCALKPTTEGAFCEPLSTAFLMQKKI